MELEAKLIIYQTVSFIYIKNILLILIQDKNKKEYEEKIEKLKKELNNNKIGFEKKEKEYKKQLDKKQKEIEKLEAKIKVLNNSISIINHKNENISINNNYNNSTIKSRINSTLYSISKEDFENSNKYKQDELYTLYKENNINNENNESNILLFKNRTISNPQPSRNANFLKIINRQGNKNPTMKNFSSNSAIKNNSNYSSVNNKRNNIINSSRAKKKLKQNMKSNNSLNITNNTFNMSKNNIMINLNPKNVNMNMNIEKLKVQKKLYEYQRLIDQKLNELIKNRNPHVKRNKKFSFYIRRNSSPDLYNHNKMNNSSQRRHNKTSLGLEYFLRRIKKKSITPNKNSKNNQENNSNVSRKILSRSTFDCIRKRKNSQKSSKSKSIKKNKNININNLKQNLKKENYNSKTKDLNNSRQDNDNFIINGKSNLSLRKYIFSKCSNPISNVVKN